MIVPRYGHTAVSRNLVKRRLRDLARRELLPTLSTCDVVIRAAPGAYAASFAVLQTALQAALQKVVAQLPRPSSRAPGEEAQ